MISRLLLALSLGACSLAIAQVPPRSGHKDPAPLSDEIVQRVMPRQQAPTRLQVLAADLERHLRDATSSLEDFDAAEKQSTASERDARGATALARAADKHQQIAALRESVRSLLAERQAGMAGRGENQLAQREAELLKAVESRFERVNRALSEVRQASSAEGRRAAVRSARRELHELFDRAHADAEKLDRVVPTFTYKQPPASPPTPPAKDVPQFVSDRLPPGSGMVAMAGVLAVAPSTPTEASSCTYDSQDLAATVDAPKAHPEIAALAEKLGYSPARIYEWVYNEIRVEPYYGSLKGALGTLYSRAGGPTDQASLLIALLRASNVPARYVKAKVRVSDGSDAGQNGRIARWLGARSYVAARNILWQGFWPNASTDLAYSPSGGYVEFIQVFAEACVPYGTYRGLSIDMQGHRWVPLDPSFKERVYQAGIPGAASGFDYNGTSGFYANYLAKRTNGPDSLPQETFAQQIGSAIKSQAPNYANNTLGDVPYTGRAAARKVDILPASLPYEVREFKAWDGGGLAEAKSLPSAHQHKFKITQTSGSAVELTLPEVALSRITLMFKGATSGDQTSLDAWKTDGNKSSTASCSINVVPVVKVDGVEKTPALGSSGGICAGPRQVTLETWLTEISASTPVNKTIESFLPTNYHALQAYAFQGSDRLIQERAARLLNSVRQYPVGTANTTAIQDEVEGEFLHIVGLKYMRYVTDAIKTIGQLHNESGESGNHLGYSSTRAKIDYLFDLPFAVTQSGLLVDMKGLLQRPVNLTSGGALFDAFLLAGYATSAYESYVWQENAKVDAVSTVRGIQFAKETSVEVIENLQSSSWTTESPKLTNNSTLNYATTEVDSIKSVYVDNGYTLRIPRRKIQYGDWTGYVFAAQKSTGGGFSAAFIISNVSAGGLTVGSPIATSSAASGNDALGVGYLGIGNDVLVNSSSTDGVKTVGLGVTGNGITTFTVTAGDPVNMVTGNMYHVERDIAVKGRGGMPLVFERSYNSRDPLDGPLGFGWTHTFNQKLVFKDDNYDGAVNAGDTDNVTSSVIWTDGTGSEKVIKISGASGSGVPSPHAASNFTVPKGFYFTVQRNSGGTYSIVEKSGLTYTFETVAGTVNQTAKLTSIKDRNNNTIALTYDGSGRLSSLSDGVQYSGSSRPLAFTYDSSGRISQIADWTGRQFRYQYDGNGNLVKFSNPLAVAGSQPPVMYEYYTSADGPKVNHAMKRYVLPRGNSMTFEYYANGRVFKHYNTLGETTTLSFNDFRRESIAVNERGDTRRFFFDQNANPIKIVEENGAERSYTYDCPNPPTSCPNPYNRTKARDPMGFETQYAYDSAGNVTQITNPSGTTVKFFEYTAFGQPGRVKDANGNYTQLKYSSTGNLLETIVFKSGVCSDTSCPSTPTASQIAGWSVNTYDSYGNLTSARRVRDFATQLSSPSTVTGPTIVYTYDTTNNYNVATMTRKGDRNGDGVVNGSDPDDVQDTGFTYDGLGRMTAGIRADWHPVSYTYDAVDRITRATDAIGKLRDFVFDANGNLAEEVLKDPNNQSVILERTAYTYDAADRKVAATAFGGLTTAFQYDPHGNVIRVTNPDGFAIGFEYDPNNNVIRAADQENNAVTRWVDVDGRPRSVTDPNGNTTSYEYWGLDGSVIKNDGRLKRVTVPKIQSFSAGRATEYEYDGNGNVTLATLIPADCSTPASCGRATATTYDELNRPVRVVGPVFTDPTYGSIRPVTKFTYDNLGNLTAVNAGRTDSSGTNPANDVVTPQMTYVYDDLGRKIKETDPLNQFWTFTYDKFGNVTQATDAKSQSTTFTWDFGHLLNTRTAGSGGGAQVTSYTRNHLGQPLTAVSPEVTYTYTYYTANNRLKDISDNRGNRKFVYSYSPGGLLNTVEVYNGSTQENRTDYVYDTVGRLTGIWAPNYDFVAFAYDAGGRLTEKWFPNGVTARYTWNADNSLAAIENRRNAGNVVSNHAYTYDAVGNRSQHVESINGTALTLDYTYDELSRLTRVINGTPAEKENYAYDVLGNRLARSVGSTNPAITVFVYDAANQLTEIRQTSPTGTLLGGLVYDANGSLTKKCEGGTVSITGSPATDCSGSTVTQLTYNLLNQVSQAAKTGLTTQSYYYDDQGRRLRKVVGSSTTNWLYLGPDIHGEYDSTWGSAAALYTHGPNTDDPIVRINSGASKFYHADGLGSIVAMSDGSGAVTGTQRFDAWGSPITGASSGTINQYGYTGREPDETGLVFYRARYYEPYTARFLQRDPIGMADGLTRYAYVRNNPISLVDPTGLISNPLAAQLVAASRSYTAIDGESTAGDVGDLERVQFVVPFQPIQPTPAQGNQSLNQMSGKRGGSDTPLETGGNSGNSGGQMDPCRQLGLFCNDAPHATRADLPSLDASGRAAPDVPARTGRATSGVIRFGSTDIALTSGSEGPAAQVPRGTPGFNSFNNTHVEAHAAAVMRQQGIREAELFINNQPCTFRPGCTNNLSRMLPEGSKLRIYAPGGYDRLFIGKPN